MPRQNNPPTHLRCYGAVNQERKQDMKKTLADAIKGMQVKSWEVREHSNGRRVVYVRFEERRPALSGSTGSSHWLPIAPHLKDENK